MKPLIKPIVDKKGLKKFIKCQWNFYKNDPNFVPPLIADRMKLLDKEKNPFFKHADMQCFLAEHEGKIVGRIAAITNGNHNKIHNDNIGFFGFFECINDQEVSNELFDTAAHWLREKGKDAMRGPVNPSQNDECGLLIDPFDQPPTVLMPYNPKYYMDLISNYGLQKAKDLYAYLLEYDDYRTPKLERIQDAIKKRYKTTIRNVNFKDKEQFRKDVETLKQIYNAAWEPNWGFVKMTDKEFDFLAEDLKQVAEPELAFIVETDGEPAGFALGLPDINQLLIKNKKGGLLGAAWQLMTKKSKIDKFRIIVLGVIPEYQSKGLDSVMYYEFGERGPKLNMLKAEASWVLEDNEKMNRGLTVTINAKRYRYYRIYEKKI